MASWTNWIDDYGNSSVRMHRPSSTEEIINILQAARDSSARVRALGSGHSMSRIARPADAAIDFSNLRGYSVPPWLKSTAPSSRLRKVEAGTTVKLLNHRLWESGLALANMGSFDGQTISGAVSTGTHGTGLAIGSIADAVRSVDILTLDPSTLDPILLTVEPSNGSITDPSQYGQGDPTTYRKLIQDDDLFYSAVVSGGLFGIFRAVVIECEQMYWLTERYSAPNWMELRDSLSRDPSGFALQARYVQALINIHEAQVQASRGERPNPTCSVVFRERASAADKPTNWTRRWPPMRETHICEDLFVAHLTPVDPDQLRAKVASKISGKFRNLENEQHPFAGQHDRSISCVVHRRLRDDFADERAPDPPPRAISLEVAVDIGEVAAAVDAVLDYIVSSDLAFYVPMGIRFAAASDHFLATNYGRATAYIEVPFIVDKDSILERVRDDQAKPALSDIERILCYEGQFSGRPHIGKFNNLDLERVNSVFPAFGRWIRQWQTMQPTDIHCNSFAEQLRLREWKDVRRESLAAVMVALDIV